jgi:hypothetical protein
VDSKLRRGAGPLGLPAKPFDKHKPYDWPNTGTSLTLVLLVSLGLWAAMWVDCCVFGSHVEIA